MTISTTPPGETRKPWALAELECGYIEAMYFADTGDTDNGQPDDEADLSEDYRRELETDCKAFHDRAGEAIEKCGLLPAYIGHDFWLTRQGHGAGFWDREADSEAEQIALDILDEIAKDFGEMYLYQGDTDGLIYGE